MDDAGFLQAVLTNPGDEATRLVYADWLEEQGDLRGEFLRLDTSLVKLHGTSKQYAEMREQWLKLRQAVDDHWARTISFRPIATIETLVHFLREFHRSWIAAPALDPESIPGDLPYGLALIYRELGALVEIEGTSRSPFGAQDALVPLSGLERTGQPRDPQRACTFAWENQGNWSCRCPLHEIDPPVFSNAADVWQEPARGFQKVCDSLNAFLITLSLHEAVFSAPYLVAVESDSPRDFLKANYMHLWTGPYVDVDNKIDFYAVADADTIFMNRTSWWIGSHSDVGAMLFKKGVSFNRLH